MIAIEIILIICGGYILYLTLKMKASGEIPPFLVNGKVNLERAKDKPGFIKYMFPKLIVFSLGIIVFAVLSLISDTVELSPYISLASYVIYAGLLIYLGIVSVKAQNKYLF